MNDHASPAQSSPQDARRFTDFGSIAAALRDLPSADAEAIAAAEARNAVLTKPPGALGRLEAIAIWLAGWPGSARSSAGSARRGARPITQPQVLIFAGNHGVVAQGVSAYPADVTAQMVANFDAGGAAINQLAAAAGAGLSVVPLALDRPTADLTEAPAMSEAEVAAAFEAGWRAVPADIDLLAVGEMGIGNTTTAAALAAATLGGAPEAWVGAGASPDGATLPAKRDAVARALARHRAAIDAHPSPALEAMRRVGGRELAAIAGAVARARVERIPTLLDGFIATAAVAPLTRAASDALDHCLAAHRSAEAGHDRLLKALGRAPILDLGLRLGEGSGAALAIPLVRAAAACLAGMASFEEAAVSGRDG